MCDFLKAIKTSSWLFVVMCVALLERVMLFLFYRPAVYTDTLSYRRLAEQLLKGWAYYDGIKTPAYPIFLAYLGTDEHVYIVQLFLGLLTTLLFFYIGWRVSGKGWFGALAALIHTLNLQQILFEGNLLTETLTTFLLTLSMAVMAWLFYSVSKRPWWKIILATLLIGLTEGAAILTRSQFIFLPLWSAFFLAIFWFAEKPTVRLSAALIVGLSGLALVGLWMNFIYRQFGNIGLSTSTGYHLISHTGAFFEYVPDEYAALRDTFLQYREARISETGSPINTIWEAIPAMTEASGYNFYDLSDVLAKISFQLILQHPGLYLKSVAEGWLWYWKAPVYWKADSLSITSIISAVRTLILIERYSIASISAIFLAGSLALVWKKVRQVLKMDIFLWFCLSILWLNSVFQSLLEHSENPRYSVTVQSLLIILVFYWGIQIVSHLQKRKK